MKLCSSCKVEKDFSEFYNDKRNKDGKQGFCKQCNRTKYADYRREYSREYMAKNSKNPVRFEDIDDKVKERFFAKVDKTDTCWNWTGAVTAYRPNRPIGYGTMIVNSRPFYAHRLSFLMHNGYLTEGLVVDHQCNNTLCVNPDHLKQMTNGENIRRGYEIRGRKTTCKYGHDRSNAPKNSNCPTCWSKENRSEYNRQRYIAKKSANNSKR